MGTRSNRLTEAVLTSTHNLCFEQKFEKYQNFYLKIFLFLVVQFSIYLNRHVSVMHLQFDQALSSNDNKALHKRGIRNIFFFLLLHENICCSLEMPL